MAEKSRTLQDVLAGAVDALKKSGIPTPRLDAEVLLSRLLDIDRTRLFVLSHTNLPALQAEEFQRLIDRRCKGEPVAYIVGFKEFWSLPFKVTPDVLIPRPETEILVEEVLGTCRAFSLDEPVILEVGTGSGAVGVALARELPGARIVATDISPAALEVAERNARLNGVRERISFLCGDLFGPISGEFDIITSNPPYIPEGEFSRLPLGVRGFEPFVALVGGPEGTEFQEALIKEAPGYLKEGGWLLMEIGDGQEKQVEGLLRAEGVYCDVGFVADYAGRLRVVRARRKG